MISKRLRLILEKRILKSDLDFKTLINTLENSETYFMVSTLDGPLGIALSGSVILDINIVDNSLNNAFIFFLIKKFGIEKFINLFKQDSFDEFFNHVIEEEILADRFASYHFSKLNNRKCPSDLPQGLEYSLCQINYKEMLKPIFDMVNSEDDYYKLVSNIFIDWTDINYKQPNFGQTVDLIVGGEIKTEFVRLIQNGVVFYETLISDEIIFDDEVMYWNIKK